MVIQTEIYPGSGYQVQQSYTGIQDGYYLPNDRYGHVSNDRYGHVSGTHMPTTPYMSNTPVLKPSVGYAQQHDGWYDTNKPQHGWNSTTTDHYSHEASHEASKYTGGHSDHGMGNSGYGSYHGAQAPMGRNRMESIKYEYSSSARPTMDHNSNGLQSCYKEWKIKNIDD